MHKGVARHATVIYSVSHGATAFVALVNMDLKDDQKLEAQRLAKVF